MSGAEIERLHLGCGLTTPAGWLNVDGSWQVVLARKPWLKELLVGVGLFPRQQAEIPWSREVVRLDLTKRLPFSDQRFKTIYCSHTLEHLYFKDALELLKECKRILKPGGVCRFVVPDLASIVERYTRSTQQGDPGAGTRLMEELMVHDKTRKKGPMGVYYRLTAFHQHKWMYDALSLQQLFEDAGFVDVASKGCFESRIEGIREIEHPGRILEGQGIAVEATSG